MFWGAHWNWCQKRTSPSGTKRKIAAFGTLEKTECGAALPGGIAREEHRPWVQVSQSCCNHAKWFHNLDILGFWVWFVRYHRLLLFCARAFCSIFSWGTPQGISDSSRSVEHSAPSRNPGHEPRCWWTLCDFWCRRCKGGLGPMKMWASISRHRSVMSHFVLYKDADLNCLGQGQQ